VPTIYAEAQKTAKQLVDLTGLALQKFPTDASNQFAEF